MGHTGKHAALLNTKFLAVVEEAIQDCGHLIELVESSINLRMVQQHIYEVNPSVCC